jgi:hypothetical protein
MKVIFNNFVKYLLFLTLFSCALTLRQQLSDLQSRSRKTDRQWRRQQRLERHFKEEDERLYRESKIKRSSKPIISKAKKDPVVVGISEDKIREPAKKELEGLPETLKSLKKIKDKESIEYEVLVYKAATDIINSAKEAEQSFDSGRALKLLTVGAKILPWRSDVVSKRNKALSTYLKVTNLMIKDSSYICGEVLNRIEYLNEIAPDAFTQLSSRKNRCLKKKTKKIIKKIKKVSEKKKSKGKQLDYLIDILNKNTPPSHAQIERKFKGDLFLKLKEITKRNNNFPLEDVLLNSMSVAIYTFKNFDYSCSDFEIDPNSVSKSNYKLNVTCDNLGAATRDRHSAVKSTANRNLSNLLSLKGGTESVYSFKPAHFSKRNESPSFKTSENIADKVASYHSLGFSHFFPIYAFLEWDFVKEDGSLKTFGEWVKLIDPYYVIKQILFLRNNRHDKRDRLKHGGAPYNSQRGDYQSLYVNKKKIYFNLKDANLVKDLSRINFRINSEKSLSMYRKHLKAFYKKAEGLRVKRRHYRDFFVNMLNRKHKLGIE